MRSFINLPVGLAEEPRDGRRSRQDVRRSKLLEKVSRNELGVLQNAEIPFEA